MRVLIGFLCVISFVYKTINCNDYLEITLTTAKLRKSTSPKPTTLYRRIIVGSRIYESADNLLDFFSLVKTSRKKGSKSLHIWNWDHWCHLQPRKGNCKKKINRFYYDSQLDQCLPFVYSGCDGNKNNFETRMHCERYCKGTIFTNIYDSTQPSFCFLQPDTGFCLALITKYYYDINERTCKKFIYGGCGGNQNKFDTLFSCMRVCSDMG